MKVKVLITLAAVCFGVVSACHAQTTSEKLFLTTADDFMSHCGPLDPGLGPDMKTLMEGARKEEIRICDMYIVGIFEGIELYDVITVQHSDTKFTPDRSICPTLGAVSPDEMRNVVVRYIQADPEIVKLKDPTNLIALLAFEKAFGCLKTSPSSQPRTPSSPVCYSSGRVVDCPAGSQ